MARVVHPGAEQFLPTEHDLPHLRDAARCCRGCDLWERATQTVFGEGPPDAPLMLVGEAPGDQEDLQGHPFVGPAGRVLDEALDRAGIDPAGPYRTNAVKHFRWVARGKRRIHEKPTRAQMLACAPWLGAELEAVEPDVVVLLGATAAQAVLGPGFSVTKQRGLVPEGGPPGVTTLATVHPSSILRAPDDVRQQAMDDLVADLRVAAGVLSAR